MQPWTWITSRILTIHLSLETILLEHSTGRKWRQRDLILTKLVEGCIQVKGSGKGDAADARKTEPLVIEPVINLDDNYRVGKAIIYTAGDYALYQLNKLRIIILSQRDFHHCKTRSSLPDRKSTRLNSSHTD